MASLDALRDRIDSGIRRRPFLRLIQHFAGRTAGMNSTADFDLGLGGALALLAVPGAFTAILLIGKYASLLQWMNGRRINPYSICLPDEYFFIVYSMAVTGLITLLRWDRLLPDERDFANLAPLSLSLPKVFGANLIALILLAAIFAIDINIASAFIFPLAVTVQLDSFPALLEFGWANVEAVVGTSAFTFLALLATQGLLMSAFPALLYRRAALAVRVVLLTLFAGTLISVLLFPLAILKIHGDSASAAHWWPPLWFLSLFESRITALQARSPLGSSYAWEALGLAALLCLAGFSLSYRRYFRRIPELQNGPTRPSEHSAVFSGLILRACRPFLRRGLEDAAFSFTVKTLLRNEGPMLCLGLWAGLGLLLSLQSLQTPGQFTEAALFTAPLIFSFFALTGMRSVFDLPSFVSANWIFRLLASGNTGLVRSACRKTLWLTALVPLLLVWLPAVLLREALVPCLAACFLHLLAIAISVELLLWNFGKVPFTCSFTPDRDRLLKAFAGSLLLLTLLIPTLAGLENRSLHQPAWFVVLMAVLTGALLFIWRKERTSPGVLCFEDRGVEAFALLRLSGD